MTYYFESLKVAIYIYRTDASETLNMVKYSRERSSSFINGHIICGAVVEHTRFRIHSHWFESEHRLFSHNSVSAFSKLRSLTKCSLDDSVRRQL